MKRAVVAIARAIDLEGAFLIAGTALLAAASSYVHPAGPLAVFGISCLLAGLALARRSS